MGRERFGGTLADRLGGGGGQTGAVYHVHLYNEGVIGSRMEMENWLATCTDRLNCRGRA